MNDSLLVFLILSIISTTSVSKTSVAEKKVVFSTQVLFSSSSGL